MLEVLSVIDKQGVQGILKLIFTNTFKNRSLWSVTTLVPFDSFAGIGLILQTMKKFAYYFTTLLTAQESKHGQTSSLVLPWQMPTRLQENIRKSDTRTRTF